MRLLCIDEGHACLMRQASLKSSLDSRNQISPNTVWLIPYFASVKSLLQPTFGLQDAVADCIPVHNHEKYTGYDTRYNLILHGRTAHGLHEYSNGLRVALPCSKSLENANHSGDVAKHMLSGHAAQTTI